MHAEAATRGANVPHGWERVRRVLAVRLDNIGDVLMTGPALRTLRQALPGAEITLLASPAGTRTAALLPWVDEVITHRAVWQDAAGTMPLLPGAQTALVDTLRAGRFDAALIFTSFSQSPYPPAYACYLAGIPIRLGQSREFGGSVLSTGVRPLPDGAHQVDRNLYLLEAAGFHPAGRELEVRVRTEATACARALLRARGIEPAAPFAVVAPGASCAARRYDAERFAAVVRGLARAGLPVVVVGADREAELAAAICAASSAISLAGSTELAELAAIIGDAAVLVANDSGPMHLADAQCTPMVILFSGTDLESQWGPRTAPSVLLRRPTPCTPCYLFACAQPDQPPPGGMRRMACLDVPPDEVVQRALALVRAPSRPPTAAEPVPIEASTAAR